MRSIFLGIAIISAVLAAGCTKKNPNLCCTDSADCEAQGLPDDAQCGEGLVCRGNQCIAEACSMSSDCDAAAPYCLLDQGGRCAEMCTADTQCPGAGQDASDMFCVSGACVACREGMDDCSGTAPVCDMGACRACKANTECASGICGTDGACVDDSMIAFVSPTGSASSDCSRLSPCSLTQSLALMPARNFIELSTGTYTLTTAFVVAANRRFVGVGADRPQITRSTKGDIIQIAAGADISFEHLRVFGATSTSPGTDTDGDGINCNPFPLTPGSRVVNMIDVVVDQNQNEGFEARSCTVSASQSTFSNNTQKGVFSSDSMNVFDRCTASGNGDVGFDLDSGSFTLTNSFATRNVTGLVLFVATGQVGAAANFNTIVDNGTALTGGGPEPIQIANDIFARNGAQGSCATCDFLGTIMSSDVSTLHFVSPDTAPFDYHITAGSVAVDAANATITDDHDFDGDPRPQGKGPDVGADELK